MMRRRRRPPTDEAILGDCHDVLSTFPDECVDFIITSPPYANNRKKPNGGVPLDEYIPWFLGISQELHRVLKPRGSFVLNMKESVHKGQRSTYVLELILELKKQGWLWVEEYVWHKKNSYPGKWPNRFRDAWERCLHFTKQPKFQMYQESVMVEIGDWAEARLQNLNDTDRLREKSGVDSGFAKNVSNWLSRDKVYPTNVLQLPTECKNRGHPATFPMELASWFIKLFTGKGDIVLDPFLGSGTSALASIDLDRHYCGIEINEGFYQLALDAIARRNARARAVGG